MWGNDKKEKASQPDFKGSINVDGKDYWVSGWKRKEGANPKAPALSGSIELKESQIGTDSTQIGGDRQPQPETTFDDLPF